MKDRFKYRCYYPGDKLMLYYPPNNIFSDFFLQKDCFFMQCTGIKDVKGNLIYEGDILKVVNGSINGIGLSDKWEVKWVGNGWNISQWSFDCTHSYEVIGNIYQNKDLLKEQK